jgi:hypothetical protein
VTPDVSRPARAPEGRRRRVAIALVHHPVLDGKGEIVTTAITNLDIHDLARSARTYGATDYFIVHPITVQRELVNRVCEHWRDGSSGRRIPDRKLALALVRAVASLEEALGALGGRDAVEVWVTGARNLGPPLVFRDARRQLEGEGKPVLVVFGTGWGLSSDVVARADAILEPIRAGDDTGYNHLSVRAACAIVLDRLCGEPR